MSEDYDKSNPQSIEKYAKRLLGKTFRQIIEEDSKNTNYSIANDGGFKKKGGLGLILENRFFHYKPNSDSRPDFPEAGVELKVSPYKKNSKNQIVAKERLSITMIDYMSVINETFDNSHLWLKARLMLLVYYLYENDIKDRLDYRIDYASLFTPSEEDLVIIRSDFKTIVNKIKAGKAHELSEGDTLYLAACTKSSNSKVRRAQPFSAATAKPRAFSFKSSYMTYVLNNYLAKHEDGAESIMQDKAIDSFEEYVTNKINAYEGFSEEQLCDRFFPALEKRPKNLEAILTYRMLGVKSNKAEEFEKANVQIKTIRVESNNTIEQHMSFPTMSFREIANNSWDDSDFKNYIDGTRFLFVVYKFDKNEILRLQGCKFWNIPRNDLTEVEKVWKKTKEVLMNGLKIAKIDGKYQSNLPKSRDNNVCHVRPHAKNASDVDILPDGRLFPKQCFWLDRRYILSQIQDLLD